jgi:hypothetical protein
VFVSFDPAPLAVSKNSVLDRLLKRVAGDHVRQLVLFYAHSPVRRRNAFGEAKSIVKKSDAVQQIANHMR